MEFQDCQEKIGISDEIERSNVGITGALVERENPSAKEMYPYRNPFAYSTGLIGLYVFSLVILGCIFKPMLDLPMYGRIATLLLFRPHGESQDSLFIMTEKYKFCVLQWDADTSELITRFKH